MVAELAQIGLESVGVGNRRKRVRELDRCLEYLETASERGLKQVPGHLADHLSGFVPSIITGITITDAIDRVFQAQEAAQRGAEGAGSGPTPGSACQEIDLGPPVVAALIDKGSARLLTERIKEGIAVPSLLLLEAHERCAWSVLGYRSWDAYARREFEFSRSRSYELLDHGRVIRALMTAARLESLPEVTPYAAGQIKSRLAEAVSEITSRVVAEPGEAPARAIVKAVVTRLRTEKKFAAVRGKVGVPSLRRPDQQLAAENAEPSIPEVPADRFALVELNHVVEFLLTVRDPEHLLARVTTDDLEGLRHLREAARKLDDLARAWERIRVVGIVASA